MDKKGEMNDERTNEQMKKKQEHCFPFSMRQRNHSFFFYFFSFDWKCAMRQINERKKEILYSTHFVYDSNTLTRRKKRRIAEVTTTTATITEQNVKECSAFVKKKKLEMGKHTDKNALN